MELVEKREFSDKKRKELADKGHALPDGSFPIENTTDLHNAIQSVGRASNYAEAKKHIIARAKALNATKLLPKDWKVTKFIDDVKDVIEKAIGTSSSANQETDERSVENYVRGNFNTNTPTNGTGGNIVSNTTEPDPQGNIAVQKDLPNATRPDAVTTIAQETRPVGDVTPSAAEHINPDVSTGGAGVYKADICPDCGKPAVHMCNMNKADDADEDDKMKKADMCPDCGKSTADCGCTKKAASSDEVTEDNEEAMAKAEASDAPLAEPTEVKKSLWGGAFSPFTK
jgi:hypothetical protein